MDEMARDATELASIARTLTLIGMGSTALDAMVRAGTACSTDIVALKTRGPGPRGKAGIRQARRDAMLDDLATRLDAVVAAKIAA